MVKYGVGDEYITDETIWTEEEDQELERKLSGSKKKNRKHGKKEGIASHDYEDAGWTSEWRDDNS